MGSKHLRRAFIAKDQNDETDHAGNDNFLISRKAMNFANLAEENEKDSEGNDSPGPSTTVNQSKKKPKKKKTQKKQPDEIDEDALLEAACAESRQQDQKSVQITSVLKVDIRQLDPDVELKHIMDKNMGAAGSRRIVKQNRNVQTIGRVIKMKQGWPVLKRSGLSLTCKNGPGDIKLFCIEHSEAYRNVQALFSALRKSHDYDSIMEIIMNEFPYHLESLLLLSQFYIMQEEPNKANDAIERALFAIENSSPKFNLSAPEHKFDYKWRDNRVFFNLIWHRVQVISSRNCFNTALQYAKILFTKNDDDPLAAILLFDSLALKAKNYEFLTKFYEEFREKRNLDMLPNFLYSTAYAYHCLFEDTGSEECLTKSNDMICQCYTRFPFVLSQIATNFSIDTGALMKRESMFDPNNFERETAGIKLLFRIFFHHTSEFWRQEKQLAWLESTSADFIANISSEIRKEVNIWREKRGKLYVGLPLNIKRHAALCGISIADGETYDTFDPFPPLNTEASYWPENMDVPTQRPIEEEPRTAAQFVIDSLWNLLTSLQPQTEAAIQQNPEVFGGENHRLNDEDDEEEEVNNRLIAPLDADPNVPENTGPDADELSDEPNVGDSNSRD